MGVLRPFRTSTFKSLSSKLSKYINYAEALKEKEEEQDNDELGHALGGQMNRLELAHAVSDEYASEIYDDYYAGNTQTY